MASIDDIAQALGIGQDAQQGGASFGKVTATSGLGATVKVGRSSIECANFCDASVGDVVIVARLKPGVCVAVARSGATLHHPIDEGTSTGGWKWVKYADGTAECWYSGTYSISEWNAYGAVYADGTGTHTIYYPFEFDPIPACEVSAGYTYTSGSSSGSMGPTLTVATYARTDRISFRQMRHNASSATADATYTIHAFGTLA